MASRISKLRRMAQRARDLFPLTGLGVGVAALSGLSLWLGFGEVDLVLLGAGIIGAVSLLVGLVTVGLGALRVRLALRRLAGSESAVAMECGFPVRTGFALPSLWYLPGARLSWSWRAPAADVRVLRAGRRLEEEVTARVRGWSDRIGRRVEVVDAFGLAGVTLEPIEERPVRVLPAVGGLKQMHVVRTLSGGGDIPHPDGSPEGERLDLRSYAPGDPIRFVLWSVFARTRELVVRTPERALSAARKTLAYLVSGPGDEPAAGAARVAVDVGALGGDWAFGADGVEEPATHKDAALEALARSAAADPAQCGKGLGPFMRRAAKDGGGRAVVFVPGKPGPWLDGVLAAASEIPADAGGRMPLEFVVCTDGVLRAPKASWLRRVAVREDEHAQDHDSSVDAQELDRVVQALCRLRAKVIVVDRRDGHVLQQAG